MNRFISYLVALVAFFGLYPQTFVVTDIDRGQDVVTVTAANGNSFRFSGCEDWCLGDIATAIMFDGGTFGVQDDSIISIHYSGVKEMLPEVFPHHEDFETAFKKDFPGMDFELYLGKDVTAELLESRTDWDWYLVEVTTYTVVDAFHAKSDDADPGKVWDMAVGKFAPGEEYAPGSRAVCYLVYELHSDGVDDSIARYDYLLH